MARWNPPTRRGESGEMIGWSGLGRRPRRSRLTAPNPSNAGIIQIAINRLLGRWLSVGERTDSLAFQITAHGHRHVAQPSSCGREDSIADGWRQTHDARLARSCRWQVLSVNQDHINLRSIAETGNAILRQMRIQDTAVLELNGFEQCSTNGLHHCAHHLVAKAVGVHDCDERLLIVPVMLRRR